MADPAGPLRRHLHRIRRSNDACEDEHGRSWCIVHLPADHPQAALNMRLIDGRRATGMPGAWGEIPTVLIPPVSVRDEILVLPRRRVHARLISESIATPRGAFRGGSELMLVFFCNDIVSSPVADLISDRGAMWQTS